VAHIIDRRLNSRDRGAVNRRRFIKRHRKHIKKAVAEAVNQRSIQDLQRGEEISIPSKDINEPVLTHGSGGVRARVLPGNREFAKGDQIPRPEQGGGGGGKAADSGEGEDDFIFQISRDEFLDLMFEDLALPNLYKRKLAESDVFETVRAGISEDGNPSQLNILRSLRSAQGRRLAMSGAKQKLIDELNAELETLVPPLSEAAEQQRIALLEELEQIEKSRLAIPFLDDYDLKFNLRAQRPVPVTQAVMFCLMDVSGSMDQDTKSIAKRFFILLYMFLHRNYKKTDIVFIRHHSYATEVDEDDFFLSRETGGTVVSSALTLMGEIIEKRYSNGDWNIYGAQASDGDNWQNDSPGCRDILLNTLLPQLQYYAYIEITDRGPQELWEHYASILEVWPESFSMSNITDYRDIYPVFRELFSRSES